MSWMRRRAAESSQCRISVQGEKRDPVSRELGIKMPIMRQRKNNGRLSRENWPGAKDKGIRFFGSCSGIPISSRISSRDATSHLPSTCEFSLSLSLFRFPRSSDQGCRRGSAVLTYKDVRMRVRETRSSPTFVDR